MPITAHLPASAKSFSPRLQQRPGQRIHSHQTVNKIGDAAQRGFKFFRRFGGNVVPNRLTPYLLNRFYH